MCIPTTVTVPTLRSGGNVAMDSDGMIHTEFLGW